jgi:hypothetical protein
MHQLSLASKNQVHFGFLKLWNARICIKAFVLFDYKPVDYFIILLPATTINEQTHIILQFLAEQETNGHGQ